MAAHLHHLWPRADVLLHSAMVHGSRYGNSSRICRRQDAHAFTTLSGHRDTAGTWVPIMGRIRRLARRADTALPALPLVGQSEEATQTLGVELFVEQAESPTAQQQVVANAER